MKQLETIVVAEPDWLDESIRRLYRAKLPQDATWHFRLQRGFCRPQISELEMLSHSEYGNLGGDLAATIIEKRNEQVMNAFDAAWRENGRSYPPGPPHASGEKA